MKNTLVFIYNSYSDPLFQNLMLSYIEKLSKHHNVVFHIVTFEQPHYFIPDNEKENIKKYLRLHNIHWHPLSFHTGRFLLLKKAWDFIQAIIQVVAIRFRYKTKIIFCFANVSASFGIVFSKLLQMKMIVYSYEPHSEFMADFGYWSRSSLKFKILNYLEKIVGREADVIMTGTKWMVDKLLNEKSKAQVYRTPTAVDPHKFYYLPDERERIRDKLKIENKQVFIYVGKFGGLYFDEEIPRLCHHLFEKLDNTYFIILTPNDLLETSSLFESYLPKEFFHVNYSRTEVSSYLSASDFGISIIPPYPSQKFRSPTKVAEYLLCGLPYITMVGISEDDEVAVNERVGLALNENISDLTDDKVQIIKSLLNEDRGTLRQRCRKVGLEYRSIAKIENYLLKIYNTL